MRPTVPEPSFVEASETRSTFALLGSGVVWIVRTGWLDVFAVHAVNGTPAGPLRHVFTVHEGQAALGIEPESCVDVVLVGRRSQHGDVLVRSVEGLGLVSVPSDSTIERALLEGWVGTLSQAIGAGATIADYDSYRRGLRDFHAHALACLGVSVAEADAIEQQRFRQHVDSARTTMHAALRELASPRASRRHASGNESPREADSSLLRACRLIGAELGVAIVPCRQRMRGVSPITAIAQASGIRYRPIHLKGKWLKNSSEPLLVFRGRDLTPAALLPRGNRGGYWYCDADSDARKPLDAKTAAELDPVAFMFYRTFPGTSLSLRDVLRFGLRGSQREWLMIAMTSLGFALSALVLPIVTAVMVDTMIPGGSRRELILTGGLLIVSAVAAGLFHVARGLAILRLQGKLSMTLEAALWDRLLRLPLSLFKQYAAGDLAERGLAVSQMQRTLTGSALNGALSGVFSLCSFGLLLWYSPKLSVLAMLMLAPAVFVTVAAGLMRVKFQRRVSRIAGAIAGMAVEFVAGIAKIRPAGAEPRIFALWAREFVAKKRADEDTRQMATCVAVFNSVYVLACVAIFYAANAGIPAWLAPGLSTGEFLAFVTAFGQLMSGALAMGTAVVGSTGLVPLYERASPILRTPPEIPTGPVSAIELTGALEVRHLAFRYAPAAPLVLRDISFRIAPGQYVALVGPSGCGKSTLFRLLLGFEAPESGSILYDGISLADLDIQAVRRQIGVVLQSGSLLGGTIKDEICGMARLSMEAIWEAAGVVGLDEDIMAMPMGMHTILPANGGGLSGGQRQRLLIARAVARKPPLLLFDEATSALDNRTQALVSRRLTALKATRFVIAHRLSTVLEADHILVMNHGRIVQSGTCAELMRKPGLFRDLAQRQLI
jgi:NHLM bacteriocin system ABC transporter ATP-binding protein